MRKQPPPRIVISASRRTDIPAFYMNWFMEGVRLGEFEVVNPFNQRVTVTPATPDKVHTIVFWSKNYGPFIDGGFGDTLESEGFNLFFNFTINSESPLLEPGAPPLGERLAQLERLCRRHGPETIHWRFDPICFYRWKGEVRDNMKDFEFIAGEASRLGIRRCITSFMDHYRKIDRRVSKMRGFSFIDPPMETKVSLLEKMERTLAPLGVHLQTCCEREILEKLPLASRITASACIPNHRLMTLFGPGISLARDSGQRVKAGCGCKVSSDIGSYQRHPCYHNCLFCYANPSSKRSK
ncbi:MAG: DUF1848 domain-containing protein [Desulfobacterales bacterium]|nr:DUF1848 domain-containing protein [Desulfobacterales bacterium]